VRDSVIRHATTAGAPAPARPLLRLRNIDKVYANGTVALRDFSLDVAPLEFVSLLGPSGCGKSTALRVIAGLGGYSGGAIDWPSAQHDAQGRPERELGFVFQEPTLMPWATVYDNVYLPFLLKDRPKAVVTDRVRAALELVGLADFAGAYPRELSGGMKMRVSIARAIVTRPKLLLLDEPFAALDEITRTKINNDLLAIWQKAECTVMFVTHSIYESVYLSNHIVVMTARPGRVIGELRIDAPYPRDTEYRLSTTYSGYCRQVAALLDQAMAAGA
jgi:NitT/TauT family transport system ATP-binding protein